MFVCLFTKNLFGTFRSKKKDPTNSNSNKKKKRLNLNFKVITVNIVLSPTTFEQRMYLSKVLLTKQLFHLHTPLLDAGNSRTNVGYLEVSIFSPNNTRQLVLDYIVLAATRVIPDLTG